MAVLAIGVTGWTWIIVGITFLIYIGVAVWARAGSTKEFYVAGEGVPPLLNGMATAADWMSAASFISMAGLIAFMGYQGSQYLMGWTGGYVLLALLLAPYLRKFGKFTVPDFIGERYYSQVARQVAVICALFVSFTYVVGQMQGVGVAFSRFLNVPFNTGIMIGMGIVFFYAVLGGMKGITYTQVAQYCVLIFAYTVPAIYISIQMTGNPIPQLGLVGDLQNEGVPLLQKLDGLVTDLGFSEYMTNKKSTIDLFMITAALMLGTAGLPHVIVRFFTVPKVRDARKSAGWALLFIAVLYTTANELQVNRDIMVLANPEIANLPAWVVALVVAGGLAAALSTAAGLLLVISSSISHDFLKNWVAPNISEKNELRAARIAIAVAVAIAGYAGTLKLGFVAEVVALAFGLAAASFFPAIVLGIFDKRMNKQGAIAGMVVGLGFTIFYIWFFKEKLGGPGSPDQYLFGISPEGIGTIGMLINLLVALVISRLTPPPSETIQELVESIRYPRGAQKVKAEH